MLPIFNEFDETEIPSLLLDYAEFHWLTFFRTTEESFVGTLEEIFSVACAHALFPCNRFGLDSGKSVVSPIGGAGIKTGTTTHEAVRLVAENRTVTTFFATGGPDDSGGSAILIMVFCTI